MHFLVFGATGACGTNICELALSEGHQVTVFARNPSKLSQQLQDKTTQVIQGDLDDEASLERASQCGANTFVSFAGPPLGGKGTVNLPNILNNQLLTQPALTDGYKKLIPILSQQIKRILILCTPSYRCDSDVPSLKWRSGEWFIKTFSKSQYLEMVGIGNFISSLSADDVSWTLFRVGGLTNGPAAPVEATFLGSGKDGMFISRAIISRWVLDEAINNRWIGRMPYICNV